VAFVVEDAYQHHGVGRRLLKRLRDVALENGITEFDAEVLPGNVAALRLLGDVGPAHSHLDRGEIDVQVDLIATGR
jgi:GNAT superfamily N-acetyltransferase